MALSEETKRKISEAKKLQYQSGVKMGFQKGNTHGSKSSTRFKAGSQPSPETEFKKGVKPWNWIEDRTKVRTRGHPFHAVYVTWRKSVFERDGYKCRMGQGNCEAYVEAHHILSWRDYPELRYQINNGITLCRAHHPRKRAEEKRLESYFQELVANSQK